MTDTASPLQPVKSERLEVLHGIEHAFFTRNGGSSIGIYNGLNVGFGSDDDKANVIINRELVASYFTIPPQNLLTTYQIHSPDVQIVDAPFTGSRPQADGLVTQTPDLALGVLTADCGPVLFADDEANIIGACHAGWQGAISGVLESVVDAMESLGSKRNNITSVLGPTISQKNYEVGPEFVDRLTDLDPANNQWFINSVNKNHSMFDLQGYVVNRLSLFGVTACATGQCTYADEENFFSYRRSTHRNESDFGRQISAIKLKQEG